MFVLRLGEVHTDDCEELATTTDWLPLDDFAEESLDGMELRCCPTCIDGPAGSVSVSDLPEEPTDDRSSDPGRVTRAVSQQ